jgi:spore maturation protein SpmA
MNLLKESQMNEKLARFLSPFFRKIFPELPYGHPAFNFMTLNFAANFLGLDNAATPFGLKAMESMQESNPDKTRASNSQIMFLCLHAAGLTLIPTSIIGYRAVMNAANPADVMIPIIITSFMGTLAALIFVSIRQRINLFNKPVVIVVMALVIALSVLFAYMSHLSDISKNQFTGNLGVGIFLAIIAMVLIYSFIKEKLFTSKGTNIFASFVEGSKEGIETAFRILPYMIAMLVAISIFRNSGLMTWIMEGLSRGLLAVGVNKEITNAIPVALLRPFSAGGARAFMFDAMQHYWSRFPHRPAGLPF